MFIFISVTVGYFALTALTDFLIASHAASATSAFVQARAGRRGLS